MEMKKFLLNFAFNFQDFNLKKVEFWRWEGWGQDQFALVIHATPEMRGRI